MNKYPTTFFLPLVFALVLVGGIIIGISISNEDISNSRVYQEVNKYGHIMKLIESNYVDSVDVEQLVDESLVQMLDVLDPHTVYVPVRKTAISDATLEAGFEGVGILFSIFNDTLFVEYPIEGGPSRKAGIRTGDKVIAVDGKPFVHVSLSDAFHVLRGDRGSKVVVTVNRWGEKEAIDITI
jgi:carboxyl-terminal processing protease